MIPLSKWYGDLHGLLSTLNLPFDETAAREIVRSKPKEASLKVSFNVLKSWHGMLNGAQQGRGQEDTDSLRQILKHLVRDVNQHGKHEEFSDIVQTWMAFICIEDETFVHSCANGTIFVTENGAIKVSSLGTSKVLWSKNPSIFHQC